MTEINSNRTGNLVLDKDAIDRMAVGDLALDLITTSLHPGLRRYSAEHIREYGVAGERAIEALNSCLRDPNKWVRCAVVITIGRLGPIAHDCVDELLHALRTTDEMTRQYIPEALARINCPTYNVLSGLFEAQYDRHQSTGYAASQAFDDLYIIADQKTKDRLQPLVEIKQRAIDVRDIPKPLLLMHLYNSVTPSLLRIFLREDMTLNTAKLFIDNRRALICAGHGGREALRAEELNFKYVLGRELPVDLAAPFVDFDAFERFYNRPNFGQEIVSKARSTKIPKSTWLSNLRDRLNKDPLIDDR